NSREVVAVKVVAKKSLNKASTENLLTEIEILKSVRHPHIVQLKDFQWDAENIYLILEWCSGGDLSRFIRSRRILPERVARRFLQQIACALQFLHERNISHLDLKPQNILLCGSVLKLAGAAELRPRLSLALPCLSSSECARWCVLRLWLCSVHVPVGRAQRPERVPPLHGTGDGVSAPVRFQGDLWSVGVILYGEF
ncbi:unnamed protein product, partial [Tetraodon nigroviridis]